MLSLPHATAVVHVATPAQLRRDAPPAASRRADSRAVVGCAVVARRFLLHRMCARLRAGCVRSR